MSSLDGHLRVFQGESFWPVGDFRYQGTEAGFVKDVQSRLRHSRADTTANEYMQELPESVQRMVGTVYMRITLTATEQHQGGVGLSRYSRRI